VPAHEADDALAFEIELPAEGTLIIHGVVLLVVRDGWQLEDLGCAFLQLAGFLLSLGYGCPGIPDCVNLAMAGHIQGGLHLEPTTTFNPTTTLT
jgi:hypothetical protein